VRCRGKPRVYTAVAEQSGHQVQRRRPHSSSKVAPEGLEPPTRGLGSLRPPALWPELALPARIASVIVCIRTGLSATEATSSISILACGEGVQLGRHWRRTCRRRDP
jgi:hypothetical protein